MSARWYFAWQATQDEVAGAVFYANGYYQRVVGVAIHLSQEAIDGFISVVYYLQPSPTQVIIKLVFQYTTSREQIKQRFCGCLHKPACKATSCSTGGEVDFAAFRSELLLKVTPHLHIQTAKPIIESCDFKTTYVKELQLFSRNEN